MVIGAAGKSRISDLESRISDLGSRISDLESQISDLGSRISNLGSRISNLGSRISDLESVRCQVRSVFLGGRCHCICFDMLGFQCLLGMGWDAIHGYPNLRCTSDMRGIDNMVRKKPGSQPKHKCPGEMQQYYPQCEICP